MSPPISILERPSAPISSEVSIAQISASELVLHWYESVAIVQAVCQTLGNQSGHPMLDWPTVFVQSSGNIKFRSPNSSDETASVQALGELLRTWLAESPYPMPLSLVVAQSTSTPPFYRSATELSEALSHYERPNRLELIRNVYERWRSADPASHGPPAENLPSTAAVLRRKARALGHSVKSGALSTIKVAHSAVRAIPRRVPRIAVPADKTARRNFPWVRWVGAATLVIAITGGLIASRIGRPAATTAGSVVSRANDRAVDAVATTLGDALNWVGRRFVKMPDPSTTPLSVAPPIKTTRRSTTGASQPLGGSPPEEPMDVLRTPDRAAAQSVAAEVPAPPAPPPLDISIVYSGVDQDVTPPVAINRQFQDRPPSGARSQDGIAVDIVVDQAGRVESATLANPQGTLQGALQATMDLSAVKVWRFRPALKAGQPVKYRRMVWLPTR